MDLNYGSRMLELDFATWDWSRTAERDGTTLYYVSRLLDGGTERLGMRFTSDGESSPIALPDEQSLARTGWGIDRRAVAENAMRVDRVLEDTPFYSRSLLTPENDPRTFVMHESLDMRRFQTAWVRRLLPFRMPRIA